MDKMPEDVRFNINEMAQFIKEWREEKKFFTPSSMEEDVQILAKLMLVASELGEAAEAIRRHDEENFKEELADTMSAHKRIAT